MVGQRGTLVASTKARLVASATITASTGKGAGDTSQYAPLLEQTAETFPVGDGAQCPPAGRRSYLVHGIAAQGARYALARHGRDLHSATLAAGVPAGFAT